MTFHLSMCLALCLGPTLVLMNRATVLRSWRILTIVIGFGQTQKFGAFDEDDDDDQFGVV